MKLACIGRPDLDVGELRDALQQCVHVPHGPGDSADFVTTKRQQQLDETKRLIESEGFFTLCSVNNTTIADSKPAFSVSMSNESEGDSKACSSTDAASFDPILLFQLTGHKRYGLSREDAAVRGVCFNTMSEALVRVVNMSLGPAFLTGTALSDGTFVLRWAVGGHATLKSIWKDIVQCSSAILQEHYQDIVPCKCGF